MILFGELIITLEYLNVFENVTWSCKGFYYYLKLFTGVKHNLWQTSKLVWPQWWISADMSLLGVDFRKEISKIRIFFDLTFTDIHTDCWKLGTILESKVVQKWKFSKNGITKNLLLNLHSSMKTKNSERFECFLM